MDFRLWLASLTLAGIVSCGRLGYEPWAIPSQDAGTMDTAAAETMEQACLGNGVAGSVLCESFEESGSERGDLNYISAGNTVERVVRPVHRGQWALRAWAPKSDGTQSSTANVVRQFPPHKDGPLFARAFVFLPATTSTDRDWMVLLGLWASDDTTSDTKISFDLAAGDVVQLAVDPAHLYPQAVTSNLRERWFCVEIGLMLDASKSKGSAELYIDDELIVSVPRGTTTIKRRGLDRLSFGLDVARSAAASEVLVDDIVVATSRIGCD